jgi:hypothetical protein
LSILPRFVNVTIIEVLKKQGYREACDAEIEREGPLHIPCDAEYSKPGQKVELR